MSQGVIHNITKGSIALSDIGIPGGKEATYGQFDPGAWGVIDVVSTDTLQSVSGGSWVDMANMSLTVTQSVVTPGLLVWTGIVSQSAANKYCDFRSSIGGITMRNVVPTASTFNIVSFLEYYSLPIGESTINMEFFYEDAGSAISITRRSFTILQARR